MCPSTEGVESLWWIDVSYGRVKEAVEGMIKDELMKNKEKNLSVINVTVSRGRWKETQFKGEEFIPTSFTYSLFRATQILPPYSFLTSPLPLI